MPHVSDLQRTVILFVIRDYTERTPLASLQATLTVDLDRIWNSLSKAKDQKLTDYFNLSFTTLPHKIYRAEKFDSDVQRLRGRFTDKSRNDFVFKPAYHKGIPADGLAFYMMDTWVRSCELSSTQRLLILLRP